MHQIAEIILNLIFDIRTVLPTAKEPFPGWVDSLNGPVGVVVAGGKGVLRTIYCDDKSYLKVIPVDIAANAFINIAHARVNVR